MNGGLPHWEMEHGSDYDDEDFEDDRDEVVRYNGHNFHFIQD